MLIETMEHVQTNLVDPLLMKKFSIIIPAYNEEKRINPMLDDLSNFISANNLPWEVIVAIDGKDHTKDIVGSYHNEFPFVSYILSADRSGMGGAIKRGVLASRGEYIIIMDADGSTKLESLITNVNLLNSYDIVNFDRYSTMSNYIPFKRRFASRGFNFILRALFGINVRDTQCGYKIMKQSVILPLVKKITFSNAFFLTAIFLHAKKLRVKVIEVPVRYDHMEGSKFTVVMTSLSYLISIVAFKIKNSKYYNYTPEFLKDLYYRKFRYL